MIKENNGRIFNGMLKAALVFLAIAFFAGGVWLFFFNEGRAIMKTSMWLSLWGVFVGGMGTVLLECFIIWKAFIFIGDIFLGEKSNKFSHPSDGV